MRPTELPLAWIIDELRRQREEREERERPRLELPVPPPGREDVRREDDGRRPTSCVIVIELRS